MHLSDFDFQLPESLIALRPATPRDSARLLLVDPDAPRRDCRVRDLPDLLRPGDALVLNDTRVIAARLLGVRDRAGVVAGVEATLHKRLSSRRWTAFMRPGKRLRPGDRVRFGDLEAVLEAKTDGGEVILLFDLEGPRLDQAIASRGAMPLPPYIEARRPQDARDLIDYQTIYARAPASVAAPTAGLHFTPDLMARLAAGGVSMHFLTLHVGAGTFLPVKSDHIADHVMHAEYGEVTPAVAEGLNAAREAGGRIVCVGTTSLRLLESATDEAGRVRPFAGETSIFITPGYRFRAADGLLTNFHLPRSTLYMLVAAFSGLEVMRAAYAHAVEAGYRFYSYGDVGLLWRSRTGA